MVYKFSPSLSEQRPGLSAESWLRTQRKWAFQFESITSSGVSHTTLASVRKQLLGLFANLITGSKLSQLGQNSPIFFFYSSSKALNQKSFF